MAIYQYTYSVYTYFKALRNHLEALFNLYSILGALLPGEFNKQVNLVNDFSCYTKKKQREKKEILFSFALCLNHQRQEKFI